MIKIEHLDKTFNGKTQTVYALKDINLDIQKGDIFGIIGMSGAGKSTLIKLISGLYRPDKGRITV
ncbi:MAG: ATP-binding cassette domain-containing protein, partial [Lachnospiraceae bacterium]|nr:ATP-binding cassette domain-containing protein [Lachnospiraceae bacterium]